MSETTIRVIPFNGKREQWNMWIKKFLARAKRCGYKGIIDGEDMNKEKKVKLNDEAYADLILAMSCKVAFGYVDEAVSNNFPEGDEAMT